MSQSAESQSALSQPADVATPVGRRRLVPVLIGVLIAAALVVAATIGWLAHGSGSSTPGQVTADSVDAGFARDMSVHHTQAVTMAGVERDRSTDKSVRNLAYDIETSQNNQIGEMYGWLDSWQQSRTSTAPLMAWMHGSGRSGMTMDGGADGALMPGMATTAQMDRLITLSGRPLDVYFLQLMVRHHQGGLDMAQYAVDHARLGYVRQLASRMVANQSNEIGQMKRMLGARGASPLPPP